MYGFVFQALAIGILRKLSQSGNCGRKVSKLNLVVSDGKPGLEIRGTKWILTGQNKSAFIVIHPGTDPKSFDLRSVEEAGKGEVHEGIYKFAEDTLTICIYQGKDKQRPTRFEATAEQPNTFLLVLKRVKKE